jgi:hypothetical protein
MEERCGGFYERRALPINPRRSEIWVPAFAGKNG